MNTLGQRINHYRRAKGLSQLALADLCGWAGGQARIGNYERDFREPSLPDIQLIANALGISVSDLVDPQTAQALSEQAEISVNPSVQDYALIPQYSAHGAAGNGHLNDHIEVKGGLVFKRAWLTRMHLREQNLHVIYVQGHSMEPTICDADVVLVDDSQSQPRDGRIFLLRKPDGELIIKRLIQSLTGGWIIRSDNTDKRAYPDQPVSNDEITALQIIGRVVWHGGAL
ncbi:XRE family transcriptional regulator [Atopomonas sediminilitoris]|uniref:XRE family transcriptional regulator n=1 Tax=Atopomonas sediminilitoris TaxID=2919919 RepID=UPI001F4EADE0|nr:LexA family transcriptional regulator [Atopomonas sediminilitoris]MCJ8168654.1 helix-turn-helix domain-containing protein [Atopomonas sediminilitoris]